MAIRKNRISIRISSTREIVENLLNKQEIRIGIWDGAKGLVLSVQQVSKRGLDSFLERSQKRGQEVKSSIKLLWKSHEIRLLNRESVNHGRRAQESEDGYPTKVENPEE